MYWIEAEESRTTYVLAGQQQNMGHALMLPQPFWPCAQTFSFPALMFIDLFFAWKAPMLSRWLLCLVSQPAELSVQLYGTLDQLSAVWETKQLVERGGIVTFSHNVGHQLLVLTCVPLLHAQRVIQQVPRCNSTSQAMMLLACISGSSTGMFFGHHGSRSAAGSSLRPKLHSVLIRVERAGAAH